MKFPLFPHREDGEPCVCAILFSPDSACARVKIGTLLPPRGHIQKGCKGRKLYFASSLLRISPQISPKMEYMKLLLDLTLTDLGLLC